MKQLHLSGEKSKNVLTSIGVGLLVALVITIFLTTVLTSLVQNKKIDEKEIISVFLIRFIATLIGGMSGTVSSDKKLLPIIGGISAIYLLILVGVGIVLFDGVISKLWLGALSVAFGGAIVLLIRVKSQTTSKKAMRYAK